MNSKKAKQLRQDMRAMDFNPSEVSYERGQAPVYMGFGLDENGQRVPDDTSPIKVKVQRGIPTKLAPCGRKLYKDMKEGMRMGEVL